MKMAHELDFPFDNHPPSAETRTILPGISWVRMPLQYRLDHINLWILDDGPDEVVLVDTGFGLEDVKQHWTTLLARIDRRVAGVVASHCHPDHIGLADWLSQRDDSPVFMTLGEYFGAQAIWHQIPGYSIPDMLDSFRSHGMDQASLDALEKRGNAYRHGVPTLPSRFHRMFAGDVLSINKHNWRVIISHGHSPEHASLYCEELGVLISGDMLLPRMTTNVGVYAAMPNDDTLGWFLCSLYELKDLPDDTLVLPSHGLPFRGVRARIEQLEAHHEKRCETLLAAMSGVCSAASLLETLFPRELDTHEMAFAMRETIAHLNHLVNRREVRRLLNADGSIRFERTA
jgi:glyoxylase-like metal-dependent hydrolase (beta-lactamase superfamily II)